MGDRRPFSFRFWSSGNRARANQTIAPPPPPPPTTTPTPTTTTLTSVTPPSPETQTPIGQQTTTISTTNPTAVPPPPARTQIPVSQTTTTTTTPTIATQPPIETQTSVREPTTTNNNPPISTTPPTTKGREANSPDTTIPDPMTVPPSTETKTDNRSTTTTTTTNHDVDELKTSSPTREITKSPSSRHPPLPSRRTTQSRSPPQPSSPSRAANQPRSTPSSPSRMKTPSTPQRAPQPRPLSRSTSRHSPNKTPSSSPNGTQPSSQSKEPRQASQEIPSSYEATTSSHDETDFKPAIAQQEPQLKTEVESAKANEIKGSEVEGKRFKQDDDEVMPSKSLQLGSTIDPIQNSTTSPPRKNLDSPTGNGQNDPLIVLNANPEETKYVKEVVETTNTEANGEMKEVNNFLTPKSESEIIDKQETIDEKEILAASLPSVRPTNPTTSRPKKRSNVAGTHKDIKDDISTFVNRMAIGDPQSTIYDRPVSVITVAGENRGASMQMGSNSSKREGSIHIHRSYKINPDESNAETTTDGERSEKSEQAKGITEDQPTTEAYINNNVQGINNSIMFNSSIAERNPGVHMVVTHVPKELTESTYNKSPLDSQKAAQVSMTRAEKLTYEPTIRRRCLRGLLLESSDSDPEKPRRHGCRVGCQQMGTENDIDVL